MGVPGSTACSTKDSLRGVSASSSSSLSFILFRSRSALVSTNGPWCGRPSLPSTGASLVPTGFAFPGTTAASTRALAGVASRLTNEKPDGGAFVDLAESVGSRKGKSRRKRGAGRRRSFMVQLAPKGRLIDQESEKVWRGRQLGDVTALQVSVISWVAGRVESCDEVVVV